MIENLVIRSHGFLLLYDAPVYSEENVWKLCDQLRQQSIQQLEHSYAVFISNSGRQVRS
jgi:N-terminal glutamine amidase